MFCGQIIYCIWASTAQRCWTGGGVFVPKTRVVRAGYVVDLNVWGGVLRVLAGDPGGQGGPVGWVLWTCGRVEMGKGKRGPSGRELAAPAWSLGHTLYHCGNQGGWRWELEGTVPLSPTVRDPQDCKSEAISGDRLRMHWLTSHCRSHPIPSHGSISFQMLSFCSMRLGAIRRIQY